MYKLTTICGWCGETMGITFVDAPIIINGHQEDTTHGICEVCADKTAPLPTINEVLVQTIQSIGNGRQVHDNNGALTGYIGTIQTMHLMEPGEERIEFRRMHRESLEKLREIETEEIKRKARRKVKCS